MAESLWIIRRMITFGNNNFLKILTRKVHVFWCAFFVYGKIKNVKICSFTDHYLRIGSIPTVGLILMFKAFCQKKFILLLQTLNNLH